MILRITDVGELQVEHCASHLIGHHCGAKLGWNSVFILAHQSHAVSL